MESAGLSEMLKPLDAGIYDGTIAFRCESNTSAEPFLFSKLKYLIQCVSPRVPAIGKENFLGRDVYGGDLFNVPSNHGGTEWIGVDYLTRNLATIASKWRGSEADDLRIRKSLKNPLPAPGNVVVPLINQDKIEEIVGKSGEPAIRPAGQLLDICDNDVGVLAVVDVCILTIQDSRVRAMAYVG